MVCFVESWFMYRDKWFVTRDTSAIGRRPLEFEIVPHEMLVYWIHETSEFISFNTHYPTPPEI